MSKQTEAIEAEKEQEVVGQKQSYAFPSLGKVVEATSLAEANEKV